MRAGGALAVEERSPRAGGTAINPILTVRKECPLMMMRAIAIALVFAMTLPGFRAEAKSPRLRVSAPSKTRTAPRLAALSLPETERLEVVASEASRDQTQVSNWYVYQTDTEVFTVYGVDEGGAILSETRFHPAAGEPYAMVLEDVSPDTQEVTEVRFHKDGQIDGELSETAADRLSLMARDFDAARAELTLECTAFWGRPNCGFLMFLMIAACGGGIVLCLATAANPKVCTVGAFACAAAASNWQLNCNRR